MTQTSSTHRKAVLALIVLSYAMIVLDISIVLTALPRLQADLGFTDAGLSWVSSIYTLFFGGFLLLGGKLGDLFGRRRMYMTGLGIFAVASLAIGLAQSAGFIVAARAVQGLGAAILAPSTLALLQVTFDAGEERVNKHALSPILEALRQPFWRNPRTRNAAGEAAGPANWSPGQPV
ncbi:MFS transporter [Thioclava sp. SK-1]|uniref:MFS transporter n=1 Tax=Thioclava sp. SK-1 TaxID=1889770 RepID=UPI0009F1BEDC|nr:MFS transporter [Thioclava sp. SK-1]